MHECAKMGKLLDILEHHVERVIIFITWDLFILFIYSSNHCWHNVIIILCVTSPLELTTFDIGHLRAYNNKSCNTWSNYTRAWGPLTHDTQMSWLVEKLETIQVHIILDLENMRDQINYTHPISKWIMVYWILQYVYKKKAGFMQKTRRLWQPNKSSLVYTNIILPWRGHGPRHTLRSLNMVHFHFVYAWGPINCKVELMFWAMP